MISKIDFSSDKLANYYCTDGSKVLNNLNRINIFIGKNNSGKSRFLRELFVNEKLIIDTKVFSKDLHRNLLQALFEDFRKLLESHHIMEISSSETGNLLDKINELLIKVSNYDISNAAEVFLDFYKFLNDIQYFNANNAKRLPNTFSTGLDISKVSLLIQNKAKEVYEGIQSDSQFGELLNFSNIYIPILRGLRPVQIGPKSKFNLQTDNYKERTYRDYFKNNNDSKNLQIYTGLELYQQTRSMLLSKREDREAIKNFEEFLSKRFFEGNEVSLVPNSNDDSLLVTIGNDERPIYDLGDGIQSIIILLYPLFFNIGKNAVIFIEEPELSLHPGLQRLFLETLLDDRFKTFQYFISTHSNHFLDITLDTNYISVYTFNKLTEIRYEIDNVSNSESNILELLGVRNSSVVLSNCTIWVEGITDRLYIKKILEVYQESLIDEPLKYLEDFHFSFIEYSGSNLVHWAFENSEDDKILANRINQKILLIADRDDTLNNPSSAKAIQLSNIKMILKDNLIVLNVREIENLLSKNVLISTINSLEKNNVLDLNSLVKSINETDYKDVYLGRFIDENILNLKNKYSSESGSGTIKYKDKFCRTALTFIKSVNDLSPDAFDLGVKVFNFIKNSNK